MGTQVLQPQDCLIDRIRAPPADFPRRRSSAHYCNYYYYYNTNNHVATSRSTRKPATRPEQKKRVVLGSAQPVALRKSSSDDSRMLRSSGVALEKVAILRRGQSLDSSPSVAVKSDVYAGSAFAVVAPSPSALPLPSFTTKKQSSVAVEDSATRDLRRLLRLE